MTVGRISYNDNAFWKTVNFQQIEKFGESGPEFPLQGCFLRKSDISSGPGTPCSPKEARKNNFYIIGV